MLSGKWTKRKSFRFNQKQKTPWHMHANIFSCTISKINDNAVL